VLGYLAGRPRRLVRKEELLDHVWSGTHVSEVVLKVCIRELRAALGDDARSPRFIETVHRRGYRFVAEVTSGTGEVAASCRIGEVPEPILGEQDAGVAQRRGSRFASSRANSLRWGTIAQPRVDLGLEVGEILRGSRKRIVHVPRIDLQIAVNQNVAKPAQTSQSLRQSCGQNPTGAEPPQNLLVLGRALAVLSCEDVVADIQDDLGTELQPSLGELRMSIVVSKLVERDATDLAETGHDLFELRQTITERFEPQHHGASPHGRVGTPAARGGRVGSRGSAKDCRARTPPAPARHARTSIGHR
jgi:hypothetical protein